MKNNDRYKRLIKFGSAAVIMAVHVVLYYLVWTYHYNNIIQERFWGRGNFLLAGVYGAILFLLHQLYGDSHLVDTDDLRPDLCFLTAFFYFSADQ